MVSLRPGMAIGRDDLIRQLIAIQYDRNDVEFERGTFRVRGDVLEIIPAGGKEHGLRIEFFGDEIESHQRVRGRVRAHAGVAGARNASIPRRTTRLTTTQSDRRKSPSSSAI